MCRVVMTRYSANVRHAPINGSGAVVGAMCRALPSAWGARELPARTEVRRHRPAVYMSA